MRSLFVICFLSFSLLSCHTKKRHQQSEYYHKIAIGLINECNPPRALSHLLKAVELNPKDFLIRHTLGVVYYTMAEYDKAIAQFTQALQINPQLTEARVSLARIYIDRDEPDKALKEIEKAQKDLTYSDYLKLISLKGLSYYKKTNYKKAKRSFEEALSLPKGENCFVYLNFGKVEMALGNLSKAKSFFKKALSVCSKEQPMCGEADYKEYLFLAELHIKQGKKKKAKYYLKLFLKKRDKGPEVKKAKKLLKQLS